MPRTTAPTVATWNVWYGNSTANIRKGLGALREAGAGVIGLQELSVDSKFLDARAFMTGLGWGTTKVNCAIPLYWDDAVYERLDEDYQIVDLGGLPWEPGTGGDTVIRKALTWVHLRHRATGEESYAVNNHIVPGIVKGGQLNKLVPKRLKVYDEQMDAVTALCKAFSKTGAVVSAGADWNVAHDEPAGADLRKRWAAVDFRSNWTALPDVEGTHGDRLIDAIFFDRCWAKSHKVLPKYGSDHSPVVVDLEPYMRAYVVDRNAFSKPSSTKNTLWAVNAETGEPTYERKPGFAITTGVKTVTVDGKKWLVTEAGYRYAMDYLRAA